MRLLFSSPFAAASLLVVACSGTPTASPEPSAPPPSTPAPTVRPTAAATPTPVPIVSAQLLADEPVLVGEDLSDETGHADFTLSASYFTDGPTQHLYTVGFGQLSGDQRPFQASSADGTDWTVDADDPLAAFESEFSPPGPIPGTVLQIGDQWVMYLAAMPPPRTTGLEIFRATAEAPEGPWALDSEPVVPIGEPGDVDSLGMDVPAVAVRDGEYVMLYGGNGGDRPNSATLHLATSEDGVVWEKHGRVVEPELCGGTAAEYISNPRLFADDNGYLALAIMGSDIYALRSADAVSWTCQASTPAFPISLIDGSDRVHTFSAGRVGDDINLMVEALFTQPDGSVISNLWLAQLAGV